MVVFGKVGKNRVGGISFFELIVVLRVRGCVFSGVMLLERNNLLM